MLGDVPEGGMGTPPLCPHLALSVSSLGLFLSCILNHNSVIIRKGFFECYESLLQITEPEKGVVGTPKLGARQPEGQVPPGTCD